MKSAHLKSVSAAPQDDLDNQSLPGWIYHDREFFEVEKQAIFRNSWQVVCHVNDIPKVGDFHTFEFFGESVVVVRARGGRARVP